MSMEQTNSQTIPKPKVCIETWGCQMNVADSEKMLALMKESRFESTQDPKEADLIILNTCHIREKARHKVISRLGVLKEMKKTQKNLVIAVAGCVAQAEGKKLLEQAPTIDLLLGPGRISRLPDLYKEHLESGNQVLAVGFPKADEEEEKIRQDYALPVLDGKNPISRYVNIQQGCNNFCTFCVVPFTRGSERSDQASDILARSRTLLSQGAKEITLLGQNVNSYGLDLVSRGLLAPSEGGPFVDLLAEVASLPGLDSLRFTTSNPHDMTKSLAELFREKPVLGKYFHLPVQSGSDRILERMKRKVTVETYLEKIKWLRDAVPDMALSTDLIVGFPGETEEDFQGTLDLVEKVGYSFIYAFKYSPRKSTAAVRFKEQVPEEIKDERLARLNALQDKISMAQNEAELGQVRRVLFQYESQREKGSYYGRTEHFRQVKVASGRSLVGQSLDVKITVSSRTTLEGELV